jgi:hypothetical protein
MVERQRYQTRLSPDRADRVDDYAAENDLTQSEAVRRLIVAGLDATDDPTTDEIAADLRDLRQEIEADRDDRERTHEMHQMDARKIASLAVGLAAVGLAVTQLGLAATYTLAAAVGILLVAYGAAPLFTPDAST